MDGTPRVDDDDRTDAHRIATPRLPSGEHNIPAGTDAPARQTAKVPTMPSVAACAVTVERKKITDDVALARPPEGEPPALPPHMSADDSIPTTDPPPIVPVGYVRVILLIVLSNGVTDYNNGR